MALAKDETLRYSSLSLRERCNIEGIPFGATTSSEGVTFTTDGSVGPGSGSPGITRAFVVDSLMFTINKSTRSQMIWNEYGVGSAYQIHQFLTSPNVPITVNTSAIIRPSLSVANASPGSRVRAMYDADKTGTNAVMSAHGWSLTDDLDFAAPYLMLWIGDSITGSGTGPTAKNNQYDWRVRNYLRSKGTRIRLVQMSVSGTNSAQNESRRANGAFDAIPADLIVYSVGMNDAAQGVAPSLYRANVDAAIAWKRAMRPRARMIIIGPTPAENNTTEAALVNLRTQAAAAVTAVSDSKVTFCDLGGAFNRATSSNYASSDTPGNRIHPNDAGHASIWTVLQPFLDTALADWT